MATMIFKGGPADGHFCVADTRHRGERVTVPVPVSMITQFDDGMGDVPRRTITYEHDGTYAFDGARVYRMLEAV